MRVLSILFTILCSAAVWNLHRLIQDFQAAEQQREQNLRDGAEPSANLAPSQAALYEQDVLATAMYSLGTGLALNVVCAFAARPLDPQIIPGTEMMACAPYGLGAAALAARLHTFSLGGWTPAHWNYARRTGPRQLREWIRRDVVDRAVSEVKKLTAGTGMDGMEAAVGCGGGAEEGAKCEL
ncbi:hypothetical protein PG991_014773 [Apiospora marii]|uniref:Uncharacterized protein n=1 Tax=Apiospora marii TaxID=335849 RepID=A0ABR1R4T6_9PEZI